MTDIEIEVDKAKGEQTDSTDSGGSGGGGGRRSTIIVKGEFGTTQIPPDTECNKCDTQAVGVLIIPPELYDELITEEIIPLCGEHRDEMQVKFEEVWDIMEFRRFVDA